MICVKCSQRWLTHVQRPLCKGDCTFIGEWHFRERALNQYFGIRIEIGETICSERKICRKEYFFELQLDFLTRNTKEWFMSDLFASPTV